jgi:hypothetical protein
LLVHQRTNLVYFADRYMKTNASPSGARKESQDEILLLGEDAGTLFRLLIGPGYRHTEEIESTAVVVPAGKFANCLRSRAEIPAEAMQLPLSLGQPRTLTGIVEESYFAPGVGLVKRVVTDEAGDSDYTLELIHYSVLRP